MVALGPYVRGLPLLSRGFRTLGFPASISLFLSLAAFSILFPCYAIIVGLVPNGALADWIKTWQPALDLFLPHLPALREIPKDLIKHGYADWAPVVQHVLLVGWMFLALLAGWIVLDIFLIRGRAWQRVAGFISYLDDQTLGGGAPDEGRKFQFAKGLFASAVMLLMIMGFLYFGLWGIARRSQLSFGALGIIQMPLLALLFVVAIVCVLAAAMSGNALLRGLLSSANDADN